jgi:hypothetical protein
MLMQPLLGNGRHATVEELFEAMFSVQSFSKLRGSKNVSTEAEEYPPLLED